MSPHGTKTSAPPAGQRLVRVESLRVSFGKTVDHNPVVCGVSFTLEPGRALGIVGESGSGKSVTARSLLGLAGRNAKVAADRLEILGNDVLGYDDSAWRRLRGRDLGLVSQDALVSLDQLRRVSQEIGEGPRIHKMYKRKQEIFERVVALLDEVGVPDPAVKARQLPHELSGGQRQRALIASALALDPTILIADEPTTALDATVQAQVLELLARTRDSGKALIIISHDLAVISQLADEVIVMRRGEVVERGDAADIFTSPQHEYTQKLLDAVPSGHSRGSRLAPSEAPRLATVGEIRVVREHHAKQQRPDANPLPVLEAHGLVKSFVGPDGVRRVVVNEVSFELAARETLGIVGESGSGKSTTAKLVLGLEAPDRGDVLLGGDPWSAIKERKRRSRRSDISIVYQDPLSSFDPRWTVDRIIADTVARDVSDGSARRARVNDLLDLVSLPGQLRRRRPLELSGGQRQRVAVARAIAPSPRVIVCDEPVSALDVSIQAQVLDLLVDLRDQLDVSYLFISHDLGVVHHVSDRVLVMHDGNVVEEGHADEVLHNPRQEYTRKLVSAVPRLKIPSASARVVG